MNQLDARLCQIRKILDAFRISLAHDNYKRCFVDDSMRWQRMPVSRDKTVFLQTLHVAFDREDRDFSGRPTQNLVGNCLRTGKRRLEEQHLTVLLFPLRSKRRKDRLLERLFHHRKSVERDGDIAALARWFRQTTSAQQSQQESR